MLLFPRRVAADERFSGRNRLSLVLAGAFEQAGGMLLSPVVVVAVCSLLTADLVDMVLPAAVATAAWIVGYAVGPALLARARRRLPWTIGASIVRAASVALLAYVLSGDDVSREQRLRSILICLVAYSVTAGLARGASESLSVRVTTAHHPRRVDLLLALVPTSLALLVGVGAFALLVDVPRSPLPRLSAMFGVAAGLSAASILFLGRIVESPSLALVDRRPRPSTASLRRDGRALLWLVVSASSTALEILAIVGIIRYIDLPRAYLLSGLGMFVAASAFTAVVAGWVEQAFPLVPLMQMSAALSGIAFALAIGLPTLLDASQAPDELFGRRSPEVGIWVVMALLGIAQQTRRRVLPRLVHQTAASPLLINLAGFALAFLPLVVAALIQRWEPRTWLLLGLAAALVGIATSGAIPTRRVAALPAARARPATALARRAQSTSGRYAP